MCPLQTNRIKPDETGDCWEASLPSHLLQSPTLLPSVPVVLFDFLPRNEINSQVGQGSSTPLWKRCVTPRKQRTTRPGLVQITDYEQH